MGKALIDGIVQTKYFAECAIEARKGVNLTTDNHVESSHMTGKVKGVETIVIDDSESDNGDDR